MKKYISFFILFLVLNLFGADLTHIKIEFSTDKQKISGFILYSGDISGVYNTATNIGYTNVTSLSYSPPKYAIIAALDSTGKELAFSNEVFTQPYLTITKTNKNQVIVALGPIEQPMAIYKSTNLINWTFLTTNNVVVETMNDQCFYTPRFLNQ